MSKHKRAWLQMALRQLWMLFGMFAALLLYHTAFLSLGLDFVLASVMVALFKVVF